MFSMHFNSHDRGIKIKNLRAIVKKLTSIRLSGYDAVKMNRDISANEYNDFIVLSRELGDKILKANFIGKEGMESYKKAKLLFNNIMNYFINSSNKNAFIYFSVQILQYYTIICNEGFEPQQNYQDFSDFLDKNTNKFGDARRNPFIIEYELIKIYNDLSLLKASLFTEVVTEVKEKKSLDLLLSHLRNIQVIVNDYINNSHDNVYINYLNFVINFTFASALEFEYLIADVCSANLPLEKKNQLSDIQQDYIHNAKQALNEIEALYDFFKADNASYINGIEYSLGQNILSKLPIKNLDEIQKYLSSLLE